MKDFIKRLSSRKFLIVIAGLLGVTVYPQYADQIVQLVGMFVGAEGIADIIQRYASEKTKQTITDARTTLLINGQNVPQGDDLTQPATVVRPQDPGQQFVPGQ